MADLRFNIPKHFGIIIVKTYLLVGINVSNLPQVLKSAQCIFFIQFYIIV